MTDNSASHSFCSRPPSRISAVVWDFDDTLVDSRPARVNALDRVFRDADIEHVDAEHFLLNMPKTSLGASLAHLSESRGKPADLFERFERIYWTKEPGTLRLYPGVEAVLDDLEQRGILLAVVTLKGRSFEIEGLEAGVSIELRDLEIASRFPVVIGFEDVSDPKPHPEGILRAVEQLDVIPEQALVVGDTIADIEAARAAGCWSCLATWGIPGSAERARRAKPDLVAETPLDIMRLAG